MDSQFISIRVRYQETDAQGIVHHANYLNYFEKARIEYLRALGIRYRDVTDGLLQKANTTWCEFYEQI